MIITKKKLLAFVILAIIGVLTFWPVAWERAVLALSGNYGKTNSDIFDVADWNTLRGDFVAKSGDTLGGTLNMGAHKIINLADPVNPTDAANKQYTDGRIIVSGGVEDAVSGNLKMVCGSTPIGSTWVSADQDGPTGLQKDIDTTDGFGIPHFSSTPRYFVSFGGFNHHIYILGATSIDNAQPGRFTLNIRYTFGTISPSIANSRGWHINWCGVGN